VPDKAATLCCLPDGTKARIAAVLEKKEGRTNFVRLAIEREIERRKRKQQKPK